MDVYSKKISIGEWKDYSISFKRNYAIFAIHKSFKIGPYFEIKKNNFKQSYFTLSFQNNVIVSSHKLNNVINYLIRLDQRGCIAPINVDNVLIGLGSI